MSHVGNDGFSNCDKLCGSDNGYSVSCVKICPGFKSSTEIPTVSTAAIEPGSKAPIEVTSDLTALIIGYVLAAFVIALALICLIYTIYYLWQRRRQRSIKMPVQEQHRITACENLIAAENGTIQQQPESNIPINTPPSETERLLLQVKDEISNEMTTLPSHEMVNPEYNLNKITPDQNKTSNGVAIKSTLKRSETDPDRDDYVDIKSILPQPEHDYDNVSEPQNRDGQDPREINNYTYSVNTTGTVFENDGDDVAYGAGNGVGSSENAGTLVRVVTEIRAS